MNCKIEEIKKILYIFGELGDSEREEIELHLNSCKVCAEEFKKLRETFEAVGKLGVGEPSVECIARIRELPHSELVQAKAPKAFRAATAFLARVARSKASPAGALAGRFATTIVRSWLNIHLRTNYLRWGIPAFAAALAVFIVFSHLPIREKTMGFIPAEIEWDSIESLVWAEEEISFSFLPYRTMEDEIAIVEWKIKEIEKEIEGGDKDDESMSSSGSRAFERGLCVCRTAERIFPQV